MNPRSKTKTIILALITVITVVLGIIAVVTALRLRKLATVPVAPTAPQSKPLAANGDKFILRNDSCEATFTIASAPENIPVTCESKTAWLGTTKLTDTSTVQVGNDVTYKIKLTSGNASQSGTITVTDVLPAGLTHKSHPNNCTYADSSKTLTCTTTNPLAEISFIATIASNSGTITNTASVSASLNTSTCSVAVKTSTTATPTPTPTATPTATPLSCNQSCSVDADCSGNLICEGGSCRNPSCTSETDCSCNTATPTPLLSCGQTCSVDADCSGDMVCESGACRNNACTSETDCVCATPAPQVNLPTAGNSLPTLSILLIGLGIVTLGAVGLMGL